MKKMLIMIALVFFAFKAEAKNNAYIDFDIFYSELSPYGEWVTVGAATAWRPVRIEVGWNPYSVGRWVWTDYGWYWDSYEPFGWATYHYGRWTYDNYYGWIWVPDYTWGPSWVEWRYNDYYIGWAPLPPIATFSVSVGIHFGSSWHSPYHHWHFVSYNYFCHDNLNYYMEAPVYNQKIFSQTKYRTNYYSQGDRIVNGGVDRNLVERRSNQKIERRDLVVTRDSKSFSSRSRDNQREVVAYRPDIKDASRNSSRITSDTRSVENRRIDTKAGENSRKRNVESRNVSRDYNSINSNSRKIENRTNSNESRTVESRSSNLFDQLKKSKAEAERNRTITNRNNTTDSRTITREKKSSSTRTYNSIPESKKSSSSNSRSYVPQSKPRSNSSEVNRSNTRNYSSPSSSSNRSKSYDSKSTSRSKPAVKSSPRSSSSKSYGTKSSSSSRSKSTKSNGNSRTRK